MQSKKIKKEGRKNLILFLLSLFSCVLIVEIAIRLITSPSPYSYGTFLGHELPPLRMIPYDTPPSKTDRSAWYNNLVVDDRKITTGDLWGLYRKDNLLGSAPMENTISLNGWWQSNNLGARRRTETLKEKPEGRKRILVFGDSFTNCSRVPQEETWPHFLESENENLEVVNFGVDGYSMCQSFLRFQNTRKNIDHDLILLLFVPSLNLWRDVNVRRDLGEGGWYAKTLMPRFVLDHGELKLIRFPLGIFHPPQSRISDITDQKIKNHLKSYDRFYFKSRFEVPLILGESVIYKLIAAVYHKYKRNKIRSSLMSPDSEAAQVSKEIFLSMNKQIMSDGGKFILTFLPARKDIDKLVNKKSFRDDWNKFVTFICESGLNCIDLSEDLVNIPENQLDTGYDGTHFGPKTNRHIADYIKRHLDRSNLL